ncbi:peroxiredoxin family protein [Paenibacillus gorillae]|uniref:peroxiredoxin family protein n=1 Tax=Paenibacillus gorillae TaxID=1243662 RepID=UPI0012DD5FE9|nr:redoxin domain-containing protein [Paenibacillus gorillae]
MYTVQLGTFVLNLEIVVYILCGIAGVAGLWLKAKKGQMQAGFVSDAMNAVLLWIFIWKASLIIVDPATVLEDPRSFIYFSGGIVGGWLATLVSCGFLLYKGLRTNAGIKAVIVWLSVMLYGWITVWLSVQSLLADTSADVWKYVLSTAVSAFMFVIQIRSARGIEWKRLGANSVLAAAALAAILLVDYGGSSAELPAGAGMVEVGLNKGQQAPDFKLVALDGSEISLSDYRGKTVFVNFWASWCPPCKVEMPHMEKLYSAYRDQDVVVLSVNMTSTEKSGHNVSSFVEERGLTFPVVLDEKGTVMSQYRVRSFPTTFVVDSEGIIRDRMLGAVDFAGMERRLKDVLG